MPGLTFPENRLERIELALRRAVELLPTAARAQLAELADPENHSLALPWCLGCGAGTRSSLRSV